MIRSSKLKLKFIPKSENNTTRQSSAYSSLSKKMKMFSMASTPWIEKFKFSDETLKWRAQSSPATTTGKTWVSVF